jgi:hypothetical protein
MDFLLEAQRLNRRRVKLEEFILLLLRCLAMALIGLLLARPFLDSNPVGMFSSGQTERVIVLDDSLSMAAVGGGKSPMEEASAMLGRWVEALAADGNDDLITVVRTTNPEKSSPNGLPLTEASMTQLLEDFKNVSARDSGGDLGAALLHVEKSFKGEKASLNRVVYVLTDLRRRDWEGSADAGSDAGVVSTLKRISDVAAGCYVIDLGDDIEEVVPLDKALIAGVPAEFEVVVKNAGSREANDVGVRFAAGEGLPVEARIDSVPAGGTGIAAFTYTFSAGDVEGTGAPEPVPVEVSLDVAPGDGSDLLAADNTRYFPARVVRGLRALVVDGDPSGAYGQSESFYLRHALSPGGPARSGVEVTVVDDTEFDNVDLDNFEVVLVANLYRVTDERAKALEAWVAEGGGLVFLLGDQVDEDVYNEVLFKDGKGLLPGKLAVIEGDEKEESWALFNPELQSHPLFRFFTGDNRQLLDGVKVFRWWRSELGAVVADSENGDAPVEPASQEANASADDGGIRVIATFTDPGKAPAVVEKGFGDGRVMVWSTPLDNDWNTFPENGATFLITAQELVRFMARNRTGEGVIEVAQPIRQSVDLRQYRSEVGVIKPGAAEPTPVEARLPEGAAPDSPVWALEFDETDKRGVYAVQLQPAAGGEAETVLFAANIDTAEGDLIRASQSSIQRDLDGAEVQFVSRGQPVIELGAASARSEIWKLILYVLAALLAAELLFGWWIGAKR